MQRVANENHHHSSLHVTPEFRHDAESVLREGETLSAFVETSLREQIERRKIQKEFMRAMRQKPPDNTHQRTMLCSP
jgi:hypothetical protein